MVERRMGRRVSRGHLAAVQTNIAKGLNKLVLVLLMSDSLRSAISLLNGQHHYAFIKWMTSHELR